MKRDDPTLGEPVLFDLPLQEPGSPPRPGPQPAPARRDALLPLFGELDETEGEADEPAPLEARIELPAAARPRAPRAAPAPAGLLARALAGVADLAVHAAVLVVLFAGTSGLGARLDRVPVAAGVFLLVFSFLYFLLPLAFWGQTPGMAWRGLSARSLDGRPPAFGQAARRWLGALATLLLAGLPLLLALRGGRSFTDRLSGSLTYRR